MLNEMAAIDFIHRIAGKRPLLSEIKDRIDTLKRSTVHSVEAIFLVRAAAKV